MSNTLSPDAETQQPVASTEKTRRNKGWLVILAICIVAVLGLWLSAISIRPEVKTSAGTLVITKARFADRFPPRCNSYDCYEAEPGYKFLIVWLKPKGGNNISSSLADLKFPVYLVADNGSQAKLVFQSVSMSPPFITSITLAFVVREDDSAFSFFKIIWSGNPEIRLNPLLYLIP